MRQERAQRENNNQLQEIRQNYQEAVQGRDEAARRGDRDEFESFDDWAADLEKAWQQLNPPQSPYSPQDIAFLNRKKAFRERYGQAADALIARAHQQAVMPRNRNATSQTHPDTYGSGLKPGTPAYFKAIEDYLELYAPSLGYHYDPNEDALTPNEAAKISGLSPQAYNNGVRAMQSQRRFSWQTKK